MRRTTPDPEQTARTPLAVLLAVERGLRTHPKVVGGFTVASVALIALAHRMSPSSAGVAMTYTAPLLLCGYGVGIVAGVVTALAVSSLWLLDAIELGLGQGELLLVFVVRLTTSVAIVGIGALAAAAARARDGHLEAQQALTEMRADLVSAFSHDLRSPLAAIMGYAQLVRDGPPNGPSTDTTEALDRILVNAERLDALIGDMLAAGHSAHAAALRVTTFSPDSLVADLRKEFHGAPQREAVALRWHVDPQAGPFQTDRAKLVSVVRNLVGNALKFTTEGSVTVHITQTLNASAHSIEVRDTGPGISPEDLPHVFDRFYRVAKLRQTPGFGLGLFIVKRFTELLGGSVTAESQLGRGTTFVVSIPHLAADVAAGVLQG